MSDATDETGLTTPADLIVKMTELGIRAQSAVIQAEVEVLAQMMAGVTGTSAQQPVATDAEVESGFDNMPV